MITRPYYPSNASGVHRAVGNAKYLPLYGWEPIVVCKDFSIKKSSVTYDPELASHNDTCRVYRVPDDENILYRKTEKLIYYLTGGGENDYRYPFDLYQRMKKVSEQIVKNQDIDAIWSTSFPGIDHKIADYLSRKYNIPWVADFRDLPDQSYSNKYTRYVVKQEIKTCSTAKALVATSDELAKILKTRHDSPVYTIFNGYDPEEYQTSSSSPAYDDKFTINHFGILYKFRKPSDLFAAIDRLKKFDRINLNDIQINFYGADLRLVNEFAKDYDCFDKIKVLNRMPYPKMIECQKKSQILLLVSSPQQGGAIPAKLYGYLASLRPVLNVPGDGAGTDRIIKKTKAGVSFIDPEDIADWLEHAYNNWKKNGVVDYLGEKSEIEKYSRKIQAGQLVELLEKVI